MNIWILPKTSKRTLNHQHQDTAIQPGGFSVFPTDGLTARGFNPSTLLVIIDGFLGGTLLDGYPKNLNKFISRFGGGLGAKR